jgi:transcriptional regulator with XRE-family HTH domain
MAIDICKRFGRRLSRIRNEKGITQDQLSERARIPRSDISQLENGRQEICLRRMAKLAKGLGMKVSELLQGV